MKTNFLIGLFTASVLISFVVIRNYINKPSNVTPKAQAAIDACTQSTCLQRQGTLHICCPGRVTPDSACQPPICQQNCYSATTSCLNGYKCCSKQVVVGNQECEQYCCCSLQTTPNVTLTPTPTNSITPKITDVISPTITPTLTPILTPIATPTPTPTSTPILTPSVTTTITPTTELTLTPTPPIPTNVCIVPKPKIVINCPPPCEPISSR